MRGQEYDDFIEAFVSAVVKRWPRVLLQWEDFVKNNATRLFERYRDRLCTFNDDVQGTAAVATGTLLAAIDVTGVPLTEQRVAVLGAGSAGCGIAGLPESEAASRFFMVDRDGLLVEGMTGSRRSNSPLSRTIRRSRVETQPSRQGWAARRRA